MLNEVLNMLDDDVNGNNSYADDVCVTETGLVPPKPLFPAGCAWLKHRIMVLSGFN